MAARATGWADLTYNPFAGLPVPEFEILPAVLVLLALWPMPRLLLALPSSTNSAAETPPVAEGVRT